MISIYCQLIQDVTKLRTCIQYNDLQQANDGCSKRAITSDKSETADILFKCNYDMMMILACSKFSRTKP